MEPRRELVTLRTPDGLPYRLSLQVEPGDPYHQSVRAGDAFDSTARFAYEYARPDELVLDVGANIGTISVPLALRGARVLAFEGLRENCASLIEAREANGLTNLTVRNNAVWSVSGAVRMGGFSAWAQVSEVGEEVEALALDDLLTTDLSARVSTIKLDIEGSELHALRGMTRLIERDEPLIVFEANTLTCGEMGCSFRDLVRSLAERGYQSHRLFRQVLAPADASVCQEVVYCDYVATRRPEEIAARAPSFEVRPLTDEEIVQSVLEQEGCPEVHQIYVALIADGLPRAVLAEAAVADAVARWSKLPAEPHVESALRRGMA